jgi:hypothetical protein
LFLSLYFYQVKIYGHDLHKCDFCNVTKLKVLLQMHSSLDEHLYEINYMYILHTHFVLVILTVFLLTFPVLFIEYKKEGGI